MKRLTFLSASVVSLLCLCAALAAWPGTARAAGDGPGAPPAATAQPEGGAGAGDAVPAITAALPLPSPGPDAPAITGDINKNYTLMTNETYTGDMQVESGYELDLNGLSLTVNGDLTILGTLHVNNGTLKVNGSVTVSGGTLLMTEPNGRAVVTGSFVTSGADHTGKLTAGTLEVGRNFIQYRLYSDRAFCPAGAFQTKLTGNVSNRLVHFDSPACSWFGKLTTAGTFNPASVFSLNVNLTDNAAYTYPHLYIQGLMNGKALTVQANTVIAGSLAPGGGTLTSGGALLVDAAGGITMASAADRVIVNGDFETRGVCSFSAGLTEIHGNFRQFGLVSGFHDNSYVCQSAHVTKIVGAGRSVHFDSPVASYFGQLDLSAGSLTADSDMSLNCDLSSDLTLPYPNVYYGGRLNGHRLTVLGNLYARQITLGGGALTVERNFTSAAANCLVMADPADNVLVKGDFFATETMDPASMAAGSVTIRGNFSQLRSAAAYTASGAHRTVLSGANKAVSFADPGSSWFNNLELEPGTSFAAGSVLSVKCDLASDASYAVPVLYFSGNLGGHTLTVNGGLHLFGETNPAGGTINASGDVALDGKLTMANGADRLVCGGAFTGAGEAALTAGSAEFRRSFHYTGTKYAASGSHATALSGGANMPVIFDNPAGAYFAQVSIASGTTLSSDSKLSVRAAGQADMALAAPQLYLQGSLGGRSLALTGSLTVPSGATLTVGGGTLAVSGGMTLDGLLDMTNAADRVTVGGAFTARGPDETGRLTNGRLYVKGNFTQSRAGSSKSFAATDGHATILMGAGAQTVSFESPGEADGSRFAKLYNMNSDQVNFSTVYYSSGYVVTSADLLSLTCPDGILVPPLSAGAADMIIVIPKALTDTTVAAVRKHVSATMTMNGQPVTSLPVTGVPYDGSAPVAIVVTAADGIYEKTYNVKVERLNTDLEGIGLSAGALDPAFGADTLGYSVALPASVEKLTITPAPGHPDSRFTIGGQASALREYALKPGESVNIQIVVTGQDGATTKTYTVTATRAAMLTGLGQSLGALTPAFSSPVSEYVLDLTALQASVTLAPAKNPGNCDGVTVDGAADTKTFSLGLGEEKQVTIMAACGSASFTYRVAIRRAPVISGFGQSPSAGTALEPAFRATGGSYTLTIPASTINLGIAPLKGPDCTNLKIDGAVTDAVMLTLPPGGSRTLSIEAEAGPIQVSFTLTVVKRAIVSALTPSQGTLSPAFSPTVYAYTLELPATSGPVFVSPTLLSGSAAVNGAAWDPADPAKVNPAPGASAPYTVVGTDGAASVAYTVTVNRQKPISGIALSTASLAPAFDAATAEYVVSLPTGTASIAITPERTAQCTALVINGAARDSVTLAPGIGGSETAVIQATGQDGKTVTAYSVRAVRQALLADIGLSTGSLTPAFDGGTLTYAVFLPNTKASVTITPEKSSSCKALTINGKKASKLVLRPAAGGAATAVITATGASASLKQVFKVTVYRISPVTGIKLSTGKLSPAFSMGRAAYTVSVPATVKSVTVTPVKAASCAALTIDGAAAASRTLSPQIGCSAKAVIAATAVNGHVYTYTVTVSRAALLKGISLSSGKLSPAFSASAFGYSVDVPASVSSVKVTPKKAATGVRNMTVNGKAAGSVTLKPPIGGSAKAVITITAKDGRTKQTYTVTVNRQPLLTGIAAAAGTLSPAFSPAVTAYTVMLPADTAATTLSVTKAAAGVKSVTIDGAAADSKAVAVPPCGSVVSTIVATASDGKTKATYQVTVKREPILSGITLSGGKLSPAFAPGTASYTVSLPATAGQVTLTPAKAAACDSFTIDGEALAGKVYSPPVGGSVTATVKAKTAQGTECTYTVTIRRAALVTGIRTSASSCPLSPAFSAATAAYTVDVPASRSSLTIYATKAKTGVRSLTINGKAAASLVVRRTATGPTVVTVVATASDGVTKSTYTVTVNWK